MSNLSHGMQGGGTLSGPQPTMKDVPFRAGGGAGLILLPAPGEHPSLAAEIEGGTATVFVLRPPAGLEADTVLVDERGGAHDAVAQLIARGHRRIGFLGSDLERYRPRLLLQGYADAMAEAGLATEDWGPMLAPQRHPDSPVTPSLPPRHRPT